jgi:hypothetical protein
LPPPFISANQRQGERTQWELELVPNNCEDMYIYIIEESEREEAGKFLRHLRLQTTAQKVLTPHENPFPPVFFFNKKERKRLRLAFALLI